MSSFNAERDTINLWDISNVILKINLSVSQVQVKIWQTFFLEWCIELCNKIKFIKIDEIIFEIDIFI